MAILADQPELMALANLAAVPASKLAAAFNDPQNFYTHIDLDEVGRLNNAIQRLSVLSHQLVEAATIFTDMAQEAMAGSKDA